MLVCVGSVRGAPGASTLALLAAGCWPRPAVLVEADPAGGVLATRYRLGRSPGLADLAAAVENHAAPAALWDSAQALPGGLAAVVAPEVGDVAAGILGDAGGVLGRWCARLPEADVIADCGRLAAGAPGAGLLESADAVVVVARPRPEELTPAAHRLRTLAQRAGGLMGLVLVGSRPYGRQEVEQQLGVGVLGVVEDDARTARLIRDGGPVRTLRRSLLVRSVQSLVDGLADRLGIEAAAEVPVAEPVDPVGALRHIDHREGV